MEQSEDILISNGTSLRVPFKDLSNSGITAQSPSKRLSVEEWKERAEVITSDEHKNHESWAVEIIGEVLTSAVIASEKVDTVLNYSNSEDNTDDLIKNSRQVEDYIEDNSNKISTESASDPVEVITLDDSDENIHGSEAFSMSFIDEMQKLQIATPKVGNPLKSYSVFKSHPEDVDEGSNIQWPEAQSDVICIQDSDSDESSENISYEDCDETIIENSTITDTFIEKFANVSISESETSQCSPDSKEDNVNSQQMGKDCSLFLDASDTNFAGIQLQTGSETCKSVQDDKLVTGDSDIGIVSDHKPTEMMTVTCDDNDSKILLVDELAEMVTICNDNDVGILSGGESKEGIVTTCDAVGIRIHSDGEPKERVTTCDSVDIRIPSDGECEKNMTATVDVNDSRIPLAGQSKKVMATIRGASDIRMPSGGESEVITKTCDAVDIGILDASKSEENIVTSCDAVDIRIPCDDESQEGIVTTCNVSNISIALVGQSEEVTATSRDVSDIGMLSGDESTMILDQSKETLEPIYQNKKISEPHCQNIETIDLADEDKEINDPNCQNKKTINLTGDDEELMTEVSEAVADEVNPDTERELMEGRVQNLCEGNNSATEIDDSKLFEDKSDGMSDEVNPDTEIELMNESVHNLCECSNSVTEIDDSEFVEELNDHLADEVNPDIETELMEKSVHNLCERTNSFTEIGDSEFVENVNDHLTDEVNLDNKTDDSEFFEDVNDHLADEVNPDNKIDDSKFVEDVNDHLADEVNLDNKTDDSEFVKDVNDHLADEVNQDNKTDDSEFVKVVADEINPDTETELMDESIQNLGEGNISVVKIDDSEFVESQKIVESEVQEYANDDTITDDSCNLTVKISSEIDQPFETIQKSVSEVELPDIQKTSEAFASDVLEHNIEEELDTAYIPKSENQVGENLFMDVLSGNSNPIVDDKSTLAVAESDIRWSLSGDGKSVDLAVTSETKHEMAEDSLNFHNANEEVDIKEIDAISDSEFQQLENFEMEEKQFESEAGSTEARMVMRKSISSLEFDAIAKQALQMLDKTTMDADNGFGAESQDDEFVDADECKNNIYSNIINFFQNDEELDALGQRGVYDNRMNLARNSLFLKFDPLLANRQSLAPFLARDDEMLRRGSALINFSPVKIKESTKEMLRMQKTKDIVRTNTLQQTLLVNINDTVNESTFLDDTVNASDITVLTRSLSNQVRVNVPTISSSTQTESEVVLQSDVKEEFQLAQLKYQGELLLKSRELNLIKKEYETALSISQKKFDSVSTSLAMTLKINQYTKGMITTITEKKNQLEKELQQQIELLQEKHHKEVSDLQEQLKVKNDDLSESDRSAMSIWKISERMKAEIEAKVRNENALKNELSNVRDEMSIVKETATTTFTKLENYIQTEHEKREEEKKHYESEIDKSMIMLKMAELKIMSLKESLEKKEKEFKRMQSVLNEVTHKFGK